MSKHIPAAIVADTPIRPLRCTHHQMALTRVEKMQVTAAYVEFYTEEPTDDKKTFQVLSDAVTQWVKKTTRGAEAWEASCEDMNIGDLACHYTGPDMLKPWGIIDLKVEIFAAEEHAHFDSHLVDLDVLYADV